MRPVSSLMSPAKPLPTPTSPPSRHPISPTPPPQFRSSFPHDFVTSLPHSSALPQNSAPLFSIPYTLQIFGLSEDHLATPLESALPRKQTSPPANPIESTRFFTVVYIFAKSVSVTLAFTTLTKYPPRNPIRMNTSTKHQGRPKRALTFSLLSPQIPNPHSVLSYPSGASHARTHSHQRSRPPQRPGLLRHPRHRSRALLRRPQPPRLLHLQNSHLHDHPRR